MAIYSWKCGRKDCELLFLPEKCGIKECEFGQYSHSLNLQFFPPHSFLSQSFLSLRYSKSFRAVYATAPYVTELVEANKLSRDLDFVNNLLEKRNIKKKHEDKLEMKYNIRRKRLNIVREEMKQRIKAVSAEIKRFNSRINQYQQNNQGRFFQRLNNEQGNHQYEIPNC